MCAVLDFDTIYLFTFLAYANLKNRVRQSNVDLLVGKVNKTLTNVEV